MQERSPVRDGFASPEEGWGQDRLQLLSAIDPILHRAVVLIEGRGGRDCPIAMLSAEIGLSERQFCRRFQACFGITPKKYVIKVRLRHACWMIANTELDITRIAYETGFSDCAHLVNSFRSVFGLTPVQFRSGRTEPEFKPA